MSAPRPYVTDPFHPLGSISINESFLYTAISIYVVGSKLQAYATRPKGGMGRLELILGFQGCWREMDMEAENTISIALQFLIAFSWNVEAIPP